MDLTEIGAVISFVAEAVARQALTAEAFPRRRSTAHTVAQIQSAILIGFVLNEMNLDTKSNQFYHIPESVIGINFFSPSFHRWT